MKRLQISLVAVVLAVTAARANQVLVEAEAFEDHGGWVLDQQFMDQMGSPFLLAHGLGEPVKDASTVVEFPAPGEYRLWVRTRDWVAPWKAPGAPGKFQVLIDGKPVGTVFGTEGAEWHWQDGGKVAIAGSRVRVALHDLTGFEGRCDALLFASDPAYTPPVDRSKVSPPVTVTEGGSYELVVVGGGVAGTCAAVKAARLGVRVALVQDRPVLGGNNSSEVRVALEGGIRKEPYPKIGGIVAELRSGQRQKNSGSAKMFNDTRRLTVVQAETNITVFLNQRVNGVEVRDGVIAAVIAQDTRSGKRMRLKGRWFADCTGDATVGFLAGADLEVTQEGHMGASNLWNIEKVSAAKEVLKCECTDTNALNTDVVLTTNAAPFPRCPWAVDLSNKPFPGRKQKSGGLGEWFWESGFNRDPIADMEWVRDQNFRAMYGAWDALKNVDKLYPNHKLNWAAFITGKRESRRLLGDVVLTADDILKGRIWPDSAFPCTWSIDLHMPEPRYQKGHEGQEFISKATVGRKGYTYKPPYWAPYRCLYSRNIGNLFMAGRDISVTHEALGAVRVMATCGMMGEVVGMAAAVCKRQDTTPRGVYEKHFETLKSLFQEKTQAPRR